MTDDGGVLGNLPRSRPGRRSDKRSGDEETKASAGAAGKAPGTDPRSGARPKPAAGPRKAAGAQQRTPDDARGPARGGDPVGGALGAAMSLATRGARLAGDLAREVLRRLPRP